MTGTFDTSEAKRAEPSIGLRITMRSAYEATIVMVSASDSPFCTLVPAVLLNPMTLPPSSWMAVSKLRRVRVEGSKNSEAMMRPFRRF